MNNISKYTTRIILILLTISGSVEIAAAQWNFFPRPHEDWQVMETEHFHVFFTPEVEPWTRYAVERMESIHQAVSNYIGYNEIEEPMSVFILDPAEMPNGMAIPFIGKPRIILWPNSPVNPLMLGGLETWPEIVMTHEYGHAVHLTRRSRNWQNRIINALVPVGPMSMKIPTWVAEGYAVIIESDLTGYGRTQSSLRSMVISQLALEGKLPSYSELNGADKWMGGRYPYLVGSAFLEWLRDKHEDPDCLLHLWKRLTAKKNRNFAEAFSGVFQDDPQDLYDRFRAELTMETLVLEDDLSTLKKQDDERWLYLEGLTGKPAVSPDGSSIALVIRPWKKPSKLVVWSTEEQAKKDPDPALEDPDDVPDLPIHPPARKELFSFCSKNGVSPVNPRWLNDGSLIFHSRQLKANGDFRSDIYRWWPKKNDLKRITHGAALSWADPIPDTNTAICLYRECGQSGLVLLDLLTGEIQYLVEPDCKTVWQSPAASPDGQSAVLVYRHDHHSDLILLNLESKEQKVIHSGIDREVILSPVWSADRNSIFYCSDAAGIMNIHMLNLETHKVSVITRSISGVLSPEYSANDGSLYYLKPHAKGMDIYHMSIIDELELKDLRGYYHTVLPPSEIAIPEPYKLSDADSIETYKPFKFLESGFSSSVKYLPYQHSMEAGFWAGDPLGRYRFLAIGGYGWDGGPSGGSFTMKYNKFPVHSSLKGFYVDQDPQEQKLIDDIPVFGSDGKVTGLEISLDWNRKSSITNLICRAGGVFANCDPALNDTDTFSRYSGGLEIMTGAHGNFGEFRFGTTLIADGLAGNTDDSNWSLGFGSVAVFAGWKQATLQCKWTSGKTMGDGLAMDNFILGNTRSSIESEWYNKNQIEIPWLPYGAITGETYERFDVKVMMGLASPVVLFASQVNAWTGSKPDPQRVAGLEWKAVMPDIPIFRLGASEMTLGVVYGIDGLIEDDWRGYFSIKILP